MVAAIAIPVPVAIAVGGLLGSAILGRRRRRWSGHQAAAAGLWGGGRRRFIRDGDGSLANLASSGSEG